MNPFLYIDDKSRRRVRVTDRYDIGTSTKEDFKAFRWFAISVVVSFFEAAAISLCLAGNLLEWALITLPCLCAYWVGLFTLVTSIKLLLLGITGAFKIARFAWTPVSTSVSASCMSLVRLLGILRTIVRALLERMGVALQGLTVADFACAHFADAAESFGAPCYDGASTPSWRMRTLWRLHLAFSRLDDRLQSAQCRLVRVDIKARIRRGRYLSADYVFHSFYNLGCAVARTVLGLTPFAVLCLVLLSGRAIFVAADDPTKAMPILNEPLSAPPQPPSRPSPSPPLVLLVALAVIPTGAALAVVLTGAARCRTTVTKPAAAPLTTISISAAGGEEPPLPSPLPISISAVGDEEPPLPSPPPSPPAPEAALPPLEDVVPDTGTDGNTQPAAGTRKNAAGRPPKPPNPAVLRDAQEKLAKTNDPGKLTVAQLKALLAHKGAAVGGSKGDLAARLESLLPRDSEAQVPTPAAARSSGSTSSADSPLGENFDDLEGASSEDEEGDRRKSGIAVLRRGQGEPDVTATTSAEMLAELENKREEREKEKASRGGGSGNTTTKQYEVGYRKWWRSFAEYKKLRPEALNFLDEQGEVTKEAEMRMREVRRPTRRRRRPLPRIHPPPSGFVVCAVLVQNDGNDGLGLQELRGVDPERT